MDSRLPRALGSGVTGGMFGWPVDFGIDLVDLARAGYGVAGHKLGLLDASQMPDPIDKANVPGSSAYIQGMWGVGDSNEEQIAQFVAALLAPSPGGKAKAPTAMSAIKWGPKESQAFVKRAKRAGGATVDMETGKGLLRGESQVPGFAVARRGPMGEKFENVSDELNAKLVDDYVRRNWQALKEPGAKLGGWVDDGKWYLDVSEVLPERLSAANATINRGERAAFNTVSHPRMSGTQFVTAPYVTEAFPTFAADRAFRKTLTAPELAAAAVVRAKSAVRGKPKPADIIARAERQVGPEDPLLRQLFGVDRAELDALTAQTQRGDNAIQVYQPTRPPSYLEGVTTPANKAWLREVLARAGASDKLAGSYGWYHTDPLVRKYQQLLGEEEGLRRYLIDNQFGAAMSPRSAVGPEITRASIAAMMHKQGRLPDFLDPKNLPPNTGHVAHRSAHSSGVRRFMKTGDVFSPDLDDAIKTRIYSESRLPSWMANYYWPTGDAHWVRGVGLDKVRPLVKGAANRDSVGATEYAPVARFFNSAAEAEGMMGSPAQALIWNALAPYTGVKTTAKQGLSAPYLELVARKAGVAAKRQGNTPEEALTRHILGKDYLGRIDPELLAILAGVGGVGLGGAALLRE